MSCRLPGEACFPIFQLFRPVDSHISTRLLSLKSASRKKFLKTVVERVTDSRPGSRPSCLRTDVLRYTYFDGQIRSRMSVAIHTVRAMNTASSPWAV